MLKKVIHVDNSEIFRKLVKIFLTEQGFFVESYGLAKQALEAIGDDTGIIISGLVFPDMSGEDFIKNAIGDTHKIPIIALTSTTDPQKQQMLIDIGVKKRIEKSGTWQDELLQTVYQYMEN